MFNKILSTALAAHLLASASATPKLLKRDTPSIPGKDFTDAGGVRAAAAAAPVWLFGREGNSHWSVSYINRRLSCLSCKQLTPLEITYSIYYV